MSGNLLENELVSDGDNPEVIRPVSLDSVRDDVALAGVHKPSGNSRVRRSY